MASPCTVQRLCLHSTRNSHAANNACSNYRLALGRGLHSSLKWNPTLYFICIICSFQYTRGPCLKQYFGVLVWLQFSLTWKPSELNCEENVTFERNSIWEWDVSFLSNSLCMSSVLSFHRFIWHFDKGSHGSNFKRLNGWMRPREKSRTYDIISSSNHTSSVTRGSDSSSTTAYFFYYHDYYDFHNIWSTIKRTHLYFLTFTIHNRWLFIVIPWLCRRSIGQSHWIAAPRPGRSHRSLNLH